MCKIVTLEICNPIGSKLFKYLDEYFNKTMWSFVEYYVYYTHYNDDRTKIDNRFKINANVFESKMYNTGKLNGFDSPEYLEKTKYYYCKDYNKTPIPKFGSVNDMSPSFLFKDVSHYNINYNVIDGKIYGEIKVLNTHIGNKILDDINNYKLYPVFWDKKFIRLELITNKSKYYV